MKQAMILVDRALRDAGLRSRMLLQVHDELLLEAPAEEIDILIPLLRERMGAAEALKVPLEVDVKVGDNWGDMTPVARSLRCLSFPRSRRSPRDLRGAVTGRRIDERHGGAAGYRPLPRRHDAAGAADRPDLRGGGAPRQVPAPRPRLGRRPDGASRDDRSPAGLRCRRTGAEAHAHSRQCSTTDASSDSTTHDASDVSHTGHVQALAAARVIPQARRRAALGRVLAGPPRRGAQAHEALREGGTPRSEGRRGTRQHLHRRGLLSRRCAADATVQSTDKAPAGGAPRRDQSACSRTAVANRGQQRRRLPGRVERARQQPGAAAGLRPWRPAVLHLRCSRCAARRTPAGRRSTARPASDDARHDGQLRRRPHRSAARGSS